MFADDPEQHSRSEDSSIAYTWLHYIEDPTNDTEYILFLPMTKAGVKAMEATTEFLTSTLAPQEVQDANIIPTQFIVSEASKVSLFISRVWFVDNDSDIREAGPPGWWPQWTPV